MKYIVHFLITFCTSLIVNVFNNRRKRFVDILYCMVYFFSIIVAIFQMPTIWVCIFKLDNLSGIAFPVRMHMKAIHARMPSNNYTTANTICLLFTNWCIHKWHLSKCVNKRTALCVRNVGNDPFPERWTYVHGWLLGCSGLVSGFYCLFCILCLSVFFS